VTEASSYDPAFFSKLWQVEDKHFWFRARNILISSVVEQLVNSLPSPSGYRVLEVGCGTGNVLRYLEQVCKKGQVFGLDLFYEGLRFAKQRVTCPLIQADLHHPPFSTRFDIVAMFDVLEHIPDDLDILSSLHTFLAPEGMLILTVPAHMSLWSYFDEASHHCRRYEPLELEQKLNQTGFKVEFITPYMTSIFPLVWLGRRLASLKQGKVDELASNELRITPVVNEVIAWVLSLETKFTLSRRRLPTGTSLLALAGKG
jgi:SAM-dependent methyltransferase